MKRNVLVIVIAVAALLGVGTVVALNNRTDDTQTPQTSSTNSTDENMNMNPQSSPPASSPNEATPNPSTSAEGEVQIEDFAFAPAILTVKKGTTVKWTNKDDVGHTVTSDNDGPLDSKVLAKGDSYTHTFDTVGTFAYHCTPHPNMTAKVVVTE
ncbi:MAG TPA: cupredoxin family copper-binding protein [Candidatus Saccharimonadales bacterium]|nr:cupredoxin family copper-binding protein [Candidatus Saccharimonadales bacterium]